MSGLAALNHDCLAGRAGAELNGIDWIVLWQADNFNLFSFRGTLRIWRLMLNDSHATGFYYNAIEKEEDKKFRDKQIS